METRKFRTKQKFHITDRNPKGKDFIIGLDLGYGATKIFYETGHICFPSYAKELPDGVTMPDEMDILYKDLETDEIYLVGYNAQNMIGSSDTNDTEAELYSRKRYTDARFRIICNTALALACLNKIKSGDERKIVIQTGLPASYLSADQKSLKHALANNKPFAVCVGNENWQNFQFNISEEDIDVIAQPMGALYSVISQNDGTFVSSNKQDVPDARRILAGRTIVLDAGFGTFDFFGMQERAVVCKDSVDEIGMRAVLNTASKMILEDTGEDIRTAAMQQYLSNGKFTVIDEEKMKSEEKSLAPYIEMANEIVLEKAKKKIQSITNSFRGYDNIIIDGGTGAAWFDKLKEWLSGMQVNIFPSDYNDRLGMIYSNARGYYMFRYNALERS